MRAPRFRMLILALFLVPSLLNSGCAAVDQTKNDRSVQDFLTASNELAIIKASWIASDADLLSATCRRLTPKLRRRLGADTSEYDSRRTTCDGIAAIRARISKIAVAASEATDGSSVEAAQSDFDRERQNIDQAVQTFPTSAFLESNFSSGPSADYRTKHESYAVDSGKIAVRFVDIAREASDYALQQAKRSSHQLDKSRADLADENYTKASVKLKNLGSTTSPSEILTQVGEVLSIVDYVLGSAQSTNKNAANPITGAHEDLPSAASPVPTATPTNTPTPEPPPSQKYNPTSASNQGNLNEAVDLVRTYYRLWNQRDYQTMYAMLSPTMQNKYPYDNYVKYHNFVEHIDVEASQGYAPSVVSVRITSQDRDKSGNVTTGINAGTWSVGYENGSMKLESEEVHEVK